MKFIRCGELEVSRIGLGTRSFGAAKHSTAGWQAALDLALDCGINLIDTAPNYQAGNSEELLGRMLRGKRGRVILSTKVGTHGIAAALNPASIRQTLSGSMKRLQTDYIDILFVHYPDPRVEYEEIARTLQALKQEGKIRYYGLSNFDQRELSRWPADDLPLFLQLPYSLLQRSQYNEVAGFMSRHGITPMVYTPLAMGLLALTPEKIAAAGYPQLLYSLLSPAAKEALGRLHRLAAEHNTGAASLALAWSLNQERNIVLAGLGSREHLGEALKALDIYNESYVRDLPVIEQPVLPLEGSVTGVIKTGAHETLVQLKISALEAEIPLWVEGPAQAGDLLVIDGLTGKPIRK